MKITDIVEMPTVVDRDKIPLGCKGVHESTLRAYNILCKVKYYLYKKVPAEIISELIDEMEGKYPGQITDPPE